MQSGSGTLHVAWGRFAAAGALRQALHDAGRQDKVLAFRDDLSCGPINPGTPPWRNGWWSRIAWGPEQAACKSGVGADQASWERVASAPDRLVVWFGRHAAMELAFYLAWVDRLGNHPYEVVDVTGHRFPFTRRDGSPAISPPAVAVGAEPPDALRSLLGSERPLTEREKADARARWQRLKDENASIRIVSEDGLVSVRESYFDQEILAQAAEQPRTVRRVVGNVMGNHVTPYIQVGEAVLLWRILFMVDSGKLALRGNERDVWACRLMLPR